MIQSNELRIGNMVYVTSGITEIATVLNIFKNRLKYETETRKGEAVINCFKPIPLTEEWLLKFGFEKEISFKIKIENIRFQLFQINASNNYNDNENEFTVTIYQSKQNIEICRIKYVHQLQNLCFALTNKERK